ncbi:RNase adapter RapZ [Gaopeijia maritima]|uniref:RapZ C-terminal domain-containing protein n=1 Tax=Gaopeijia maritima TaxID=3119007 RepID=UPI003253CF7B
MYARLLRLFRELHGVEPTEVRPVAAHGSARSYHRLEAPDGRTVVGGVGPEPDENRAFWAYTRAFRGIGLPVPELLAVDEEAGVWLMEDLGDTTLFDALDVERGGSGGAFPESMLEPYRRVVQALPRFQIEGHRVVDYDLAYPRAAFDRQSILWDLNYFKYHFLKLAHLPFREAPLERDFDRLIDFLLEADTDHFLYRDFQSRNVMLRDGQPWFIDYQGGRRGALQYDVASILYDAKADIPEAVRSDLLEHYLEALQRHTAVDRDRFLRYYPGYVLVRILQALGAYGYRGFFEQKSRFLQSVPYAARNIAGILDRGLPLELPEVEAVFERIVERWSTEGSGDSAAGGLQLKITSFSYKRGYPDDRSGHGGGFVFDCRAIPNPGREARYRDHTGLQSDVADFIQELPEARSFWEHVRGLADAQVDRYRDRGFTHLSISFGCTGGQHRSVFFAERLAAHLREHHSDVGVTVEHRERPYWPGPS